MNDASQPPKRLHRIVDAVVYALSVTVLVFLVALVLAALFTNDLSEGVVGFTFLFGFLLFGIGTFKLRPSTAWKKERSTAVDEDVEIARTDTDETGESIGTRERTPFQAAVQRLPPLRWYSIPPEHRYSMGLKLFLTGVAVLVGSLLTDVVLHNAFS